MDAVRGARVDKREGLAVDPRAVVEDVEAVAVGRWWSESWRSFPDNFEFFFWEGGEGILHGRRVGEVDAVEALVNSRVRDVGELSIWGECDACVPEVSYQQPLRNEPEESIPLGSTKPSAATVTAPVWSFQR